MKMVASRPSRRSRRRKVYGPTILELANEGWPTAPPLPLPPAIILGQDQQQDEDIAVATPPRRKQQAAMDVLDTPVLPRMKPARAAKRKVRLRVCFTIFFFLRFERR